MWVAVGYESKKIYAKGATKADCLRFLQKEYPYKTAKRKTVTGVPVFEEPLKIIKRSR